MAAAQHGVVHGHEKIIIDILDEEFQRYLDLAKPIVPIFRRSRDREIITAYVKKCCHLTEPDINVKKNRNEFFKFFLKMMTVAAKRQPPYYDEYAVKQDLKPDRIMHVFSPDKRTFIAAKVIPGYGALIYLAASRDPKGWVPRGFRNYKF